MGTPTMQLATCAAAITQTLAKLGQQVSGAAVAVHQVGTVATVMSATRNASFGREQPLPSSSKQPLTTPPKQPVMVCRCVSVGLVAPDRKVNSDDSHWLVQEYEDGTGGPQYAVFPPTVPPYSLDWIAIAQNRYKPLRSSAQPPPATAGDRVLRFLPPSEVKPQWIMCQWLRRCGCHLDIDPDSGSRSERGISKIGSEEAELVLARPIKISSPVKTAFPDSLTRGWGYHQSHNAG